MKRRGLFLCLLLSLIIFSLSCGGGGNGNNSSSPAPTTQSIAGIWIGTFTSNVVHSTYSVTGIITESGIARFANTSWPAQYSGVVNVSSNSFSSTTTAYAPFGGMFPNGSHVGVVNISGTFTPKVTLSGTYNGVGDSGTFFLNYSSLYERPSSLEVIAGKWSGSVSGYLNTITIDSSGNITGSSTSGCTYSGNISIIDSSYNAYIVNLNINNCESQNGLYTGLAALADTSVANDTLLASVSNSSYSYVALLIRQ